MFLAKNVGNVANCAAAGRPKRKRSQGPESKAEGEEKKAERSTTRQDTMINDEGQNVDLYIPRKW